MANSDKRLCALRFRGDEPSHDIQDDDDAADQSRTGSIAEFRQKNFLGWRERTVVRERRDAILLPMIEALYRHAYKFKNFVMLFASDSFSDADAPHFPQEIFEKLCKRDIFNDGFNPSANQKVLKNMLANVDYDIDADPGVESYVNGDVTHYSIRLMHMRIIRRARDAIAQYGDDTLRGSGQNVGPSFHLDLDSYALPRATLSMDASPIAPAPSPQPSPGAAAAPSSPPEVPQEEAAEGEQACGICLVYKVNAVFPECGHMMSCYDCAKAIFARPLVKERLCPVCRKAMQMKPIQVFK
jgi:hypothetical protein